MSIAAHAQRTAGQRQWIAAGMKQNPEHVSKNRGTVRRFKYMGWEGGLQIP